MDWQGTQTEVGNPNIYIAADYSGDNKIRSITVTSPQSGQIIVREKMFIKFI